MSYEQRTHRNYFAGVLSLQATISDTTLSSLAFVDLPNTYSTTFYLPIVLHNPALGLYEVVWITGHTTASQSVTVVRGKEGSTAQAWPAQTQFIDAANQRDLLLHSTTRAALPGDPYYGLRSLIGDESYVVERTVAGWGPSVGICTPADAGPNQYAVQPPTNSVIVTRTGHIIGTTNGSGQIAFVYKTPFPTTTIGLSLTSTFSAAGGPFVILATSAAGATVEVRNGSSAVLSGSCSFTYIATGY